LLLAVNLPLARVTLLQYALPCGWQHNLVCCWLPAELLLHLTQCGACAQAQLRWQAAHSRQHAAIDLAAHTVIPNQQLQLHLRPAHLCMCYVPVHSQPLEGLHICCMALLQPALRYCLAERHLRLLHQHCLPQSRQGALQIGSHKALPSRSPWMQ
jgi:hypothetical protein